MDFYIFSVITILSRLMKKSCSPDKMNCYRILALKGRKDKIGLRFAWQGIIKVIREERNFQIHRIIGGLVVILSVIVQLNFLEWTIVLLTICLVLVMEMINTLIERLIDYFKPEQHEKAKHIKDIAAGSVLITAIFAAIIGLIIFIPKLLQYL